MREVIKISDDDTELVISSEFAGRIGIYDVLRSQGTMIGSFSGVIGDAEGVFFSLASPEYRIQSGVAQGRVYLLRNNDVAAIDYPAFVEGDFPGIHYRVGLGDTLREYHYISRRAEIRARSERIIGSNREGTTDTDHDPADLTN
jgi:hypothetical protein